jgi:hypothetical protein
MSRIVDWLRSIRLLRWSVAAVADNAGQDEASLEETKAVAREYLEEAGYYKGRAPHVVSSGHGSLPAAPAPPSKAGELRRPRQSEPSDDGDTALPLAAALTFAEETNKEPVFGGGEAGGAGASDSWDSPGPA